MKYTALVLSLIGVLTIASVLTEILAVSEVVVAVSGSTPIVDGLFDLEEWDDADTVKVSTIGDINCTVYTKQDGANLYVGFSIPDVTYNSSDSCVIIFDVNHDESPSLHTDDTWLRVSRTGVENEFNVTAGGWFPTTVSGWSGQASSTSSAWQCEYNITYSKVDVTAGTNKTLGIMFLIVDKDVEMGWYVWPSTASVLKPVTWGDMASNGYNWIPEFPTWTSVLLLLIVLAVVIAIYKRRLLKTQIP